MYLLEEKIWFWLMILPILVAILFFINEIWKSRTQQGFITQSSLLKLSPNRSIFKPYLKMFVSVLSLIVLIFSMVNLQIGSKIETYKRFGVDIVFVEEFDSEEFDDNYKEIDSISELFKLLNKKKKK
mgnify:CR=1 FL=1